MKKGGESESGQLLKTSKGYLIDSDEVYRSIFEHSMDAILLTGTDGSVFSANSAASKMFGMSEEEICRLGRTGLVDNSDPRLNIGLLLRERSGSAFGELTMIRKNGERFPVEFSSNLFRDPSGKERTSMIIRDISERRKSEMNLLKSEEEYRNLFENSMIGISQATPEGQLLRINKAYAQMYGYPDTITMLNEIKGNSLILYPNPDDWRRVMEILQEKGSMAPQEFMLRRRNGEYFWALVGAKQVMDKSGKLIYLQAEHIDISPLKELEKEMQQVSIYTRNLIEASIDSLVTISADGKITDVNFATEKITGIERKKLIGSDIKEYFTQPDKAGKCFEIVLKNGVIKDYPLTIFHKSGRQTDVLYNATLFTNEAGEVQGIFAAARDITIRKKIEKELRKSKELLEKLNRHQNEIRENERALISREVHDELGQSMTALKLDLFMMRKYVSNNSEAVIKLENMIALISDTIKTVQRISSDLRPGILDDLGLVAAIEWYCEEFEKRTGICCSHELDNCDFSDPRISLTFFRVLQEGLTNVIRHSGASAVNIKLHNSRKGTTLTVLDNGIGITMEKVESYTSLGLINIRERVRQFNGKATIISKHGEGTKVTVFIPS
jgi:PAS domain S-box-containing protein